MGKTQAVKGSFSRRPDNTAFKQQRLPAWSPSLAPHTVLPIYYSLSLVCVLLGVWLLITVQNTQQLKVDYTEAGSCNVCYEMRKTPTNAKTPCQCTVNFNIPKTFLGDVFFYYGLINFHQNLRRYMDSRDDAQLVGRKNSLKSPSSYCEPFASDAKGIPIAPCGAVANSMFNDSFRLVYHLTDDAENGVPFIRKGIAWYTDKNVKFHNPKTNSTLQEAFQGTAQPIYWQDPVYELDSLDANNNGFINDDLIVWMREAAFPNFKKLYAILNRAHALFSQGLPAAENSLNATANLSIVADHVNPFMTTVAWHVSSSTRQATKLKSSLIGPLNITGRKEVVITTVTWFGGHSLFLPIAYLVTGGLIFIVAIILTVVFVKMGRDGKNMEE